jgi:lysozyme
VWFSRRSQVHALAAVAVTMLGTALPASRAAAAPASAPRAAAAPASAPPASAPRAAAAPASAPRAAAAPAADSTDYTNPYFRADFAAARAAGLAVAPYHFYLGRTAGTGRQQADRFIAALRGAGYTGRRPGELPPVLDLEWDWKGGCPPYATVADARAWLDRARVAFGRQPIIYTNRTFVYNCLGGTTELGGYPLQIAYYGGDPRPPLPPGWRDWLMWQWTATDCVEGVPTCSLTRSVFNGDSARLRTLSNRT